MCWQAIPRLCMSIRETLSNSIDLAGISQYGKGALMQISKGLGTFVMVLFEGSSETELFRHLSDYVFQLGNFENTKSMRVIFFFKISKLSCRFQKCSQKLWKRFSFPDNCIWIGIIKLSLLRTGYPSSPANVLTSSPKNLHVNKRDFSNTIDFAVINEDYNDAVMMISTVLVHVCHVACGNLLRNGTF